MKLQQSTFNKGLAIFISAFPQINVVNEIWWELLRDLDDAFFVPAIIKVCKNTSSQYPMNAPIGLIREAVFDLVRRQSDSVPKLQEPRPEIQGSLMDEYKKAIG